MAESGDSFAARLDAEIARIEAIIERVDTHPDIPTGVMGVIRLDWLAAAQRLREFYPIE